MRWNPFKRGDKTGGKKPAPKAPSSGLGPGVSGPAGAGGEKPAPKRGLLGKLFGRKPKPAPAPKPKEEKEEPAVGGPPTASGPEPEGGGPGGGPAGGGGEPKRTYPSSLFVSATGWWKISKTYWYGTAKGTLTGAAVKIYIDALEAGELDTCIYLIAEAYDDGSDFAKHLDIDGCDVQID